MSPLVKSLVADNEPPAIHLRGRVSIMHRIESRFRFLAVSTSPAGHRTHIPNSQTPELAYHSCKHLEMLPCVLQA